MNISKYNLTKCADRGATLKIKNPASRKIEEGVTVTCRGMFSTEAQRIFSERDKRKAVVAAQKLLSERDKDKAVITWTADDEAQFNTDLLASCITAWTGFTDGEDDKPLECTIQNVRAFVADVGNIKITEQISAFISEYTNFFPKLDKG